jgi:hypothetical protein
VPNGAKPAAAAKPAVKLTPENKPANNEQAK